MPKISNLSIKSANIEADAFAKLMDGGFIDIYDGAQPESADEPLSSTHRLGVTLSFGSPAFLPAAAGVITANQIMPGVAVMSLNPATWARIYQKDHKTAVMDVSVGTRDAVIILPSTNLPAGITVTCSFFTHVIPRFNRPDTNE